MSFEGTYYINNNPKNIIIIKHISDEIFSLTSSGVWNGVGLFDGTTYIGSFRYTHCLENIHLSGVYGIHQMITQYNNSDILNVLGTNKLGVGTPFRFTIHKQHTSVKKKPIDNTNSTLKITIKCKEKI